MLDKHYDAAASEKRIADKWDEAQAFAAGAGAKDGADAFTIVIPPPNVTGSLHMGHALNNTLQDILVRYNRMNGKNVLWQPGTDHAGIATQMVVERQLNADGTKRTDFTRDEFIDKVWKWKAESGNTIYGQLKRLGASLDWSRDRFTMGDPTEENDQMQRAVMEVFVRLYEEGLIYRDKKLVNWDPKFETAISDLEVENIEVNGHMWHFKYPLAGGVTYDYVEKDEDGNETLRETRDYISIATTRPETMLGDGAVAVHPSDERYASIVGKLCEIPVGPKEHRRLIPIITDEYPDPDFGSGAVKITGAHDFNDYEVAKRNAIPLYRLMDTKGAMRADGAPYAEEAGKAKQIVESGVLPDAKTVDAINLVPEEYRGLDRFEARDKVVADITAEGLAIMVPETDACLGPVKAPLAPEEGGEVRSEVPLVEAKKIMQPFGDRSKVVIEPMLTDQWFADAETLAKPAIAAVEQGRTKFVPSNWDKTYFEWMRNIQPWCISRQLWWGHQIPVWYGPELPKRDTPYSRAEIDSALSRIGTLGAGCRQFVAKSEQEAFELASRYYGENIRIYDDGSGGAETGVFGIPSVGYSPSDSGDIASINSIGLFRDPDVLDTWFSSALWPFSTLGWPYETPELETYYPTSVLSTAFDIIFFWVARMMMMGLHFTGKEPFHTVYIHALVRAADGQKMSKSKGNGIDPMDLFDEFGVDAVRFTLAAMAAQGRDLKLDTGRIAGYRNFGTKLWNAARFAEMNDAKFDPAFDPASAKDPVNRWILSSLTAAVDSVSQNIESYRFNDAAAEAYRFVWNQFCDWYLELAKPVLQGDADEAAKSEARATTGYVLSEISKLMHPFMPYITEVLHEHLHGADAGVAALARWPEGKLRDAEATADIEWLVGLVSAVRSARSEMNIAPGKEIDLFVVGADQTITSRLLAQKSVISRMIRAPEIGVADAVPSGAVQIVYGDVTLCLPVAGIVDFDAETKRLDDEIKRNAKEIDRLEKKLGNAKFVANAPAEVVEENREKLANYQAEGIKLSEARDRMAAI
ncbi:MAG: valine--tRNA ligase [Pseudomonadota bacterium]